MHFPQTQAHSFVIQITPDIHQSSSSSSASSSLSAMKLFNRFRKILMRILFSFPSNSKSSERGGSKQHSCERYDPPKTSCSSYYSSQSHYSEAIADCIEFFNKSSQEQDETTDSHVLV
ncbi:uncharacterized protein [Euphorbia lathyris]|uniref:uncharacterized protein n=1 Tax=Euphorbia lathyris TaxID=212925 RepID=UPI0033132B62